MVMEKGVLIGRGRTADVFAWGTDRVLKLYHPRIPYALVEQEYQITQAAHQAGLPVPAVDHSLEVDERAGIIFERIEGVSLLQVLSAHPWKVIEVSHAFAELHALIHSKLAPAALPAQQDRVAAMIKMTPGLDARKKETVLDCLATLPAGKSFCHGDFHPDNILWTGKGPIIIDWMTGSRGDSVADVARTSLLFQSGGLPPHVPWLTRRIVQLFRNVVHRQYLRRYSELVPLDKTKLQAWELPLLAYRLVEVEGFPREQKYVMEKINKISG
jgi:tRNA A-37 threonylcarbamoyl transferase component Bud32